MEHDNNDVMSEDIEKLVLETGDLYSKIYNDIRHLTDLPDVIAKMSNEKDKYLIVKAFDVYNSAKKYDLNYTSYPFLIKVLFLMMSLYRKKENFIESDGDKISSEIASCEAQLTSYLRDNNCEIITDINSLTMVLNKHFFTLSANYKNECEKKINDAVVILEKANAIYVNRGVQDFASEYEIIRKNESEAKNIWLILSLVLLGTASIIFYLYIFPLGRESFSKDFSYAEHLFVFLIRISYVALVVFVFIWVSKRYLVARNNEILYRHITTMLNSFRSFYDTADSAHKGLVIMEAAKVIFPAPIDRSADMQLDGAKMLDIVKILSKRE